jgi:ABC-type Fe3+ transport system substrate-binding protein
MLPMELQQITTSAGGVTAAAKQPEPAKAFIRHLTSPEASTIYKSKGLGL